jgi:hypothetical protein
MSQLIVARDAVDVMIHDSLLRRQLCRSVKSKQSNFPCLRTHYSLESAYFFISGI